MLIKHIHINSFLRLLIVLLIWFIGYSNEIELNAIAYTIDNTGTPYNLYIDGFNKYAHENNIDIRINLNLLTKANFTISVGDSVRMVESLLMKRNNRYDIYFYDNSSSKMYSPYLLDLSKGLSEELINMYDKNILSEVCRYNGKLVGMPITLATSALYSNKLLLDKYDKKIPTTWDELIETGKYILEKERALNNTELIGYNGYFHDFEEGICSLYEFMYSCRESYESPFPELTSQYSVEALKRIKRIKEEISSDEIFHSGMDYSINKINDGKAIFLKFYPFISILKGDELDYEISGLPGIKEGLSGTILVGYNVGIDGSIDKKKEKSAFEVLQYISSKEFQKSLVLEKAIISGILSMYGDEDICSKINNCEYYKNLQVIGKPINKTENFNEYSEKFTSYFYEYLYGNETEENVLKKMDDLTKVYYISVDSKETNIGLIFMITLVIILSLMILSTMLIIDDRYEKFFVLLPKPLWFMMILGILMILSIGFTYFGKITVVKCHLKSFLFFIGYSFIYLPILYKLIIIFPIENKFSSWIFHNKYLFYGFHIFIDLLLNGLSLYRGYNVKNVIIENGENYQTCSTDNLFTKLIFIFTITYKAIIMLFLLILIFMEWHNKVYFYDTRIIVSSIYMNLIIFLILSIFDFFIINSYKSYIIFYESVFILASISNYIILYCIRLMIPLLIKKDEVDEIIDRIRVNKSLFKSTVTDNFESFVSNTNSVNANSIQSSFKSNSLVSKILYYHYAV